MSAARSVPIFSAVGAILTATSPLWRAQLADHLARAGLAVTSVQEGAGLRAALATAAPGLWLALAGAAGSVREWALAAHEAQRVWLALIEPEDSFVPADWPRGGGAVLDRSVRPEALSAALDAARAGLLVLAPRVMEVSAARSPAPLSPREREVLAAAAAGLGTKAIARELGVSPNTVKFHLQAVYAKLGAATRTEAVVTALRTGLLSI